MRRHIYIIIIIIMCDDLFEFAALRIFVLFVNIEKRNNWFLLFEIHIITKGKSVVRNATVIAIYIYL